MNVQEQVHQLLAPIVATLQVELFDVEYSGSTLRVFVEEAAGAEGAGAAITTDRLAQVNRLISPILDQHDPVPGRYTLEVSSPGLERPLKRPSQFQRAVGEEIVVKMISSVVPRRYKGRLLSIDPSSPGATLDGPADGSGDGPGPALETWAEPAIGGSLALAGSLTLEASEVDGVPLAGPEARVLDLLDVASARTVFAWGPGPKPGQGSRPGQAKAGKAAKPGPADERPAKKSPGKKNQAEKSQAKKNQAEKKQSAAGAGAGPGSTTSPGAATPPAPSVPDNPPTEVCDEQ